jgi:hypothetical protein
MDPDAILVDFFRDQFESLFKVISSLRVENYVFL